MIRVIVIDDHPVVREGLVAVLGDRPDVDVVGSAGTAEEAIELTERTRPDVVLLDLELPGLDGIGAIPRLIAAHAATPRADATAEVTADAACPDRGRGHTAPSGEAAARPGPTRVLVFTAYDGEERVLGALEAGASGYLLKGASVEEIVRALHDVWAGGTHLAPRVAAQVVLTVGRGRRAGGPLTAREREVLRLVAAGLQNKQIARELQISERTVKYHVTAIMTRLDADNRAQAVAIATSRGLLG